VQNGAKLADGKLTTAALYEKLRDEELAKLPDSPQLKQARRILDDLVLGEFVEFLTLPAVRAARMKQETPGRRPRRS